MRQLLFFIFSLGVISASITNSSSSLWTPLTEKRLTILTVHAQLRSEVFAAAVDKTKGSVLLHSKDKGETWNEISTTGNNLDIAVTNDKSLLCGVGTKIYCIHLPLKANTSEEIIYSEVALRASAKEVHPLDRHGLALVGLFHSPIEEELINGVAYNSEVSTGIGSWHYSNIGLSPKQGYFASGGSFPTPEIWYVTSGSWPVQDPYVGSMLSGRLNIVNGKMIHDINNYYYEFLSLNLLNPRSYIGAISKTRDGGKTWIKIFDSDFKYYFNQIHCYDYDNCIVVGEGSFSSVIMLTNNGGETWETVLKLDSSYSLHTCKMISNTEYWVAGGMKVHNHDDQNNVKEVYMGIYYHSLDAGKTWSMNTLEGYVYDLSFSEDGKIGYGAVLHEDHCQLTRLD